MERKRMTYNSTKGGIKSISSQDATKHFDALAKDGQNDDMDEMLAKITDVSTCDDENENVQEGDDFEEEEDEPIDDARYDELMKELERLRAEREAKNAVKRPPGRPRMYERDPETGKAIKPPKERKPYVMTEARKAHIEKMKEQNRLKNQKKAELDKEKARIALAKKMLAEGDKDTVKAMKSILNRYELEKGYVDIGEEKRKKKKGKKKYESSSEEEDESSEDEKPKRLEKKGSVKEKVQAIEQKPAKPLLFFE
jgi:hypothetical protein